MNEQLTDASTCRDMIEALPAVKLTVIRARTILQQAGNPPRVHQLNGTRDHEKVREVHLTVPPNIKMLTAEQVGDRVFRQYVRSPEDLNAIKRTSLLRSGPTVYYEGSASGPVYREFPMLSGIFLTTPDATAKNILPEPHEDIGFVDIKLPEGTGVIEIEKDVLLIPTPKTYRDWIVREYEKYRITGESPYLSLMQQIDAEGGIQKWTGIPITVVESYYPPFDTSRLTRARMLLLEQMISGDSNPDVLLSWVGSKLHLSNRFAGGSGTRLESVQTHTSIALRRLGAQAPMDSSRLQFLLKTTLLFHDIGKSESIVRHGTTEKQHVYTLPIARPILEAMRFSEEEVRIAEILISNNLFERIIMRRIAANDAAAEFKELTQDFQTVSRADFLDMWLKFYSADAGSHAELSVLFEGSSDGYRVLSTDMDRFLELVRPSP